MRATKTGFKTVIRENIVLESGRIQSVSITLPLGAVSQEVTVTGALSALETSNAKISTVVTADSRAELSVGPAEHLQRNATGARSHRIRHGWRQLYNDLRRNRNGERHAHALEWLLRRRRASERHGRWRRRPAPSQSRLGGRGPRFHERLLLPMGKDRRHPDAGSIEERHETPITGLWIGCTAP